MQSRRTRQHHRRRGSYDRDLDTEAHAYYDSETFAWSDYNVHVDFEAQYYEDTMKTPPPPYVESFVDHVRQDRVYQQQQPWASVQLEAPQSKALRKKKSSVWSSPADSSHHPKPSKMASQEQGFWSTQNLAKMPESRVVFGIAPPQPEEHMAANVDRASKSLEEILSRVDGLRCEIDDLEALAVELSMEESRRTADVEGRKRSGSSKSSVEIAKVSALQIHKSWLYANSRLPRHIYPYIPYVATWPIFCRAAEASASVYKRSKSGERHRYVDASWRNGTKAMEFKSVIQDHDNLIIIAISGSKWRIADWTTNLDTAPIPPTGFLDDETNACHSGFLQTARSMVHPVATHLRHLLEEDTSRASCSLVFTGHSAGGAVASLLYLHMLSAMQSELTVFNGAFKRTHCVTFGVPPISLLPLQNPTSARRRRCQFVSFINEGDPIARAEIQYMQSLARLIISPRPKVVSASSGHGLRQKMSRHALKEPSTQAVTKPSGEIWPVPSATLSNAGQLVLLREKPNERTKIEAVVTSDEGLRGGIMGVPVVFGDVVMHHIDVYDRRIQGLAIAAVTGRDVG